MDASLRERVDRLIREVMPRRLRDAAIADESLLHGELGIDSLGLMSLAFRVEEEFGIDVIAHAERVAGIFSVGELRRFVAGFAATGAAQGEAP